ncbi:tRNA (adenosine(37)-N6)-threonylcarbamoyltransferase complex ATPase subunit type 1 TsaE [Flavobacterium silvaticum]|uniref:tRNA threonylcarbamoyladenosine biosynthesis protein TsaE n=1 Tax=Flavobacterium silvaticum TaxID=1852020 RepID=A0A972FNA4_9FLAO|nr:tRNA (adenosine(37)-N6)-threonylcarbamoyltransferase complex ATPase subunit type 1 TsaE [Flavobacterium silvaticum]NMH28832.1 tRNA (adenosine(37)-N6)-threonylcarbamoyltransferase complex ATPase subunit type 1 TsaE [Flavobacterium silvaticum]
MHFEYNLEEIHLAAKYILDSNPHKVVLFYGEMGVGKTTLIKEVARSLGVEGATSSPTFSLVNEYRIAPHEKLYHFDMYRLKTESEAYDIGIDEYLYSGHWCFVEWPENIPNLIPDEHTKVKIFILTDEKRQLTID